MSFSTPEPPREGLIADPPPKPFNDNKDSWAAVSALLALLVLPLAGLYIGWLTGLALMDQVKILRILLALLVISSVAEVVAAETSNTWNYCARNTVRALGLMGIAIVIGTCLALQHA